MIHVTPESAGPGRRRLIIAVKQSLRTAHASHDSTDEIAMIDV
jgi:hypothetical protein